MADSRESGPTGASKSAPFGTIPPPAASRLEADVAAITDIGRVRETNEDAYLVGRIGRYFERLSSNLPDVLVPARSEECGTLMMVADGMGGMAGGEVASHTAIARMVQMVFASPKWALKLDDPSTREAEIQQMWARGRAYLAAAHAAVRGRAAADPNLAGMGTTLTSAYSVGTDLFVLHVGDSRAYLFHDGRVQKITRDHTMAQSFLDMGIIREEDSEAQRLRRVLTQAVGGPGEEVDADLHALKIGHGDRLVLCTDGLTNLLDEEEMAETLGAGGSSQDACRALVDLALDYGGLDNITAIVASFSGAPSAAL